MTGRRVKRSRPRALQEGPPWFTDPVGAPRELGLLGVARLAGVSTATVSNTLNRPHMVSPATRAKVLAAIEALDFVPNRAAAALRQGFNRLIGLVVPDIVNPFYAAIADAVSDAADRHGHAVALCVSHDDPVRELRQFGTLAELRAAGALVVPVTADSSRLSQLTMVGARLILVDRLVDPADACSVAIDDVHGGRLALDHLLDCPGTGVTIVNGSLSISQCADRRTGARQALTERGLDPDGLVEFVAATMTLEAGIAIGRQIALGGAPRRVFCTNDQLALGVIRGLALEGVSVPDQAVVVGYGDLALGTEGTPGLTTVSQPKRELGEVAVERLLAELEEGSEHQHSTTVLEPELIVRGSTAPAA